MKKIGFLVLSLCFAFSACSTQTATTVNTSEKGTQWE